MPNAKTIRNFKHKEHHPDLLIRPIEPNVLSVIGFKIKIYPKFNVFSVRKISREEIIQHKMLKLQQYDLNIVYSLIFKPEF